MNNIFIKKTFCHSFLEGNLFENYPYKLNDMTEIVDNIEMVDKIEYG